VHTLRPSRRLRTSALVAATAGLALAGLGVVGAGPASAAAPGNDNIAGATALMPNTPVLGSTDEATLETGEDREGGSAAIRTVWYRYTPTGNQDVSFETSSIGDNVDTVISLYTGPATGATFAGLTFVDSNDDGADLYSYLAAAAVTGTTYYLQVDAYDADTPHGTFALRVNLPGPPGGAPANNNLAAASRLIPGINATVDNRTATTEAGEPGQASCVMPIHNSVWFHYTAAIARSTELYSVGATGSVVNVYSGPANATAGQLTAVACRFSNSGDAAPVVVAATAGTEYYVQVGSPSAGGSPTPFTFVVEQNSWVHPSKVSASGTSGARTLTLTATAAPDPYASPAVPNSFGGTVEFLDGNGASLGSAPLTGSTASLTVPRPTAGNRAYTVLFISSTDQFRDAFRSFTVSVPKLASTTTVKAPKRVTVTATQGKNGKPVIKAKKVKVKATVATGGATPTGTVTFKIGKKTVTRTLTNGVVTLKIKIKRTTKVIATYSGDASSAASSAKVKIKVKVKRPQA